MGLIPLLLTLAACVGGVALIAWLDSRPLSAIRCEELHWQVEGPGGHAEKNGAIYPQSQRLDILVRMTLRGVGAQEGPGVVISFLRPSGDTWEKFSALTRMPCKETTFRLDIEDLSPLQAEPGTWRVEIRSVWNNALLWYEEIRVVSEKELLDAIQCDGARTGLGAGMCQGATLFLVADEESFRYQAQLTMTGFAAGHYHGLSASLCAVNRRTFQSYLLFGWPLAFNAGVMVLDVEYPLAALAPGEYALWLGIGRGTMALNQLHIISPEAFAELVSLDNLAVEDSSGWHLESDVVLVSQHPVIRPVLTLRCPRPYTGHVYDVSVVVTIDGIPRSRWQGDVVFRGNTVRLGAGELRLHEPSEVKEHPTCGLLAYVEDHFLGARVFHLYPGHGPVADIEGQLNPDFDEDSVDLAAEAQRIRQAAGAL
jgi:hypothetical protein